MTCDELELLLPDELDPLAQAHLDGCERCRQTAALLAGAAQPAPSAAEKAKLTGLASAVLVQWERQQHRRSSARAVVGLALAAALGAGVTSAVLWKPSPPRAVEQPDPEEVVVLEDAAPPQDDELTFEVSWPSLNEEGDVL